MLGRDAGADLGRQHIQTGRRQIARLAHALEAGGPVDPDLPGLAQRREGGIDVGHVGNKRPELRQREPAVGCWFASPNVSMGTFNASNPRSGRAGIAITARRA